MRGFKTLVCPPLMRREQGLAGDCPPLMQRERGIGGGLLEGEGNEADWFSSRPRRRGVRMVEMQDAEGEGANTCPRLCNGNGDWRGIARSRRQRSRLVFITPRRRSVRMVEMQDAEGEAEGNEAD